MSDTPPRDPETGQFVSTSNTSGSGDLEEATGAGGKPSTDAGPEELAASDDLSTRREYQMRLALAQALGENLPGDEDYYEVFQWDKDPSVEDFYALALRNPYAYAVTFFWPELCWRDAPTVVDKKDASGDDEHTSFEKDITQLADDLRLWHYCRRADKLAGIGKFGVLVLQFDDINGPDGLEDPVGDADELQGLRPFSRASISDVKVGGPGSDRWGEPVKYQLDFSDENEQEGITIDGPEEVWVHWTRVIHVPSEELLDDEIRGVERQRPVYNNLIDIERTLGAAGTLAYRAAAWGIHINIDKDFQLDDDGDQLREHLQRWNLGLENVLRTHGADDVKSLGGEEIDPSGVIDPNVEAISAQTGIPQSVLKGNETGERSTTEDLKEVYGRGTERRNSWIEPQITRPVIDRLLQFDIISAPSGDGYQFEWVPFAELSEEDQATVRKTRAEALNTWNAGLPQANMSRQEEAEYLRDGTLPQEFDDVEDDVAELEDAEAQASAARSVDEITSEYEAAADGGEEAGDADGA